MMHGSQMTKATMEQQVKEMQNVEPTKTKYLLKNIRVRTI